MKGKLFINGKDAYETWGIFMDENSMSQLRMPAGLKDVIANKSRLRHGTQYVKTQAPRFEERAVTLNLQFIARTEEQFNARYNSFVGELYTGRIHITTYHEPNVEYKCLYGSCNQYSEFMQGIAKFVLKLTEPNPADRELDLN